MDKPLYKLGDRVKFGDGKVGEIWISDPFGTFEQNEEPSYDIYVEEDNTLYKHIRQSFITEPENDE